MADIVIRGIPDEVVARLDQLKGDGSREAFLRRKLSEIADAGEVPPPRIGKGIRAFTPSGGKVRIVNYRESTGGGASNLGQKEFDAYQRASLLVDSRNGGKWQEAIEVLQGAGFEVFWD